MISLTLNKITDRRVIAIAPKVSSANIASLGNEPGRYNVKLRNGSMVSNVPGPASLRVGQSVCVAKHSGGGGHYSVLVQGIFSSDRITEVWV